MEKWDEFFLEVKIRTIILFLAGVMFIANSCQTNRYFAFDDVRYVNEFPVTCTVKNPIELPIDTIGIRGLKVCDDFIMVSCVDSNGCISVFSKEGCPITSPILRIGRGPGEVLFHPYMSWISFGETQNGRQMSLYDFKGNYLKYDFDPTISQGKSSFVCILDSLSMMSGASYFMMQDSVFLCRRIRKDNRGYERFIVNLEREEYVNSAMSHLNSVYSTEKNLLSSLFVFNRKENIIAELGA